MNVCRWFRKPKETPEQVQKRLLDEEAMLYLDYDDRPEGEQK